jgi:hypothetical protein
MARSRRRRRVRSAGVPERGGQRSESHNARREPDEGARDGDEGEHAQDPLGPRGSRPHTTHARAVPTRRKARPAVMANLALIHPDVAPGHKLAYTLA